MMTLKNSAYRSSVKLALIIPFFVILGITFGCEPARMEKNNQIERINLELADTETIKLNGKTVSTSKLGTALSKLLTDSKHTLIDLKVHNSAPMGLITMYKGFSVKLAP